MHSTTLFLTSVREGWLVNDTPLPRYPGNDWIPIVYEARWATGPVRTDAEYVAAAGIRSSNRPARS